MQDDQTYSMFSRLYEKLRKPIAEDPINLISAIVGLIAGILSVFLFGIKAEILHLFETLMEALMPIPVILGVIALRQGAPPTGLGSSANTLSIIVFAILITLIVAFFWALRVAFARSHNEKAAERAWDIVKLLAGFFVGTLTGYLGSS